MNGVDGFQSCPSVSGELATVTFSTWKFSYIISHMVRIARLTVLIIWNGEYVTGTIESAPPEDWYRYLLIVMSAMCVMVGCRTEPRWSVL